MGSRLFRQNILVRERPLHKLQPCCSTLFHRSRIHRGTAYSDLVL